MKVLVTGGTGFLGSHCVAALARAGHDLRLLVRNPQKIGPSLAPHDVTVDDYAVGDMADESAVSAALEGCDAVVHAAVTMYGDAGVRDANIAGVHNVVGGAAARGIDPIIYISSVGSMFPPPGPIATADDPVVALETTYGHSKSEGERVARALQADGAAITTLYPGGINGPHDPVLGETSRGIRDAVRLFFPISPTGGVSIVDVRDLAILVTKSLEKGAGPRRFMTGGHFVTWSEFADACTRVTGRRMWRVPAPPFLLRASGRFLDALKTVVDFDYPLTHEAALFMTQLTPVDSRPVCEAFDFAFRPLDDTVRDTLRWLFDIGELSARAAGDAARK